MRRRWAFQRESLFHSKRGSEGILTLVLIEYQMVNIITCSVKGLCAERYYLRPY